MASYTVYYRPIGSNMVGRCGYSCNASSESEAISLWKKTDQGKNGKNEMLSVERH